MYAIRSYYEEIARPPEEHVEPRRKVRGRFVVEPPQPFALARPGDAQGAVGALHRRDRDAEVVEQQCAVRTRGGCRNFEREAGDALRQHPLPPGDVDDLGGGFLRNNFV